MKNFLLGMMFLFSSHVLFAEDVVCTVTANHDVLAQTDFSLNVKEQHQYVSAGTFSFYLSNLGNSKFEIEVYNNDGPTRFYTTGLLRTSNDILTWTLWSRDILLETSCKLADQ